VPQLTWDTLRDCRLLELISFEPDSRLKRIEREAVSRCVLKSITTPRNCSEIDVLGLSTHFLIFVEDGHFSFVLRNNYILSLDRRKLFLYFGVRRADSPRIPKMTKVLGLCEPSAVRLFSRRYHTGETLVGSFRRRHVHKLQASTAMAREPARSPLICEDFVHYIRDVIDALSKCVSPKPNTNMDDSEVTARPFKRTKQNGLVDDLPHRAASLARQRCDSCLCGGHSVVWPEFSSSAVFDDF
jgi:hypothetical protein